MLHKGLCVQTPGQCVQACMYSTEQGLPADGYKTSRAPVAGRRAGLQGEGAACTYCPWQPITVQLYTEILLVWVSFGVEGLLLLYSSTTVKAKA